MARVKMFDFTKAEVEGAFADSVQRVLEGQDMQDPRPAFDPKQAAEVAAEQAGGRSSDLYRRALEAHRFTFVPAVRLPRFHGVVPQPEGQWRHEKLGLALYPSDLPKQFPEGPEQFDRWIREEKEKRRLTRLQAPKHERRRVLQDLRRR